MSDIDSLRDMRVEIHFKENSIPSIHAGKLTEKSISELEALIAQERIALANEIIGEDEWHQDTSFGGALPKFQTSSMAVRNQLRQEQRKRLKQLTHTAGEKNE